MPNSRITWIKRQTALGDIFLGSINGEHTFTIYYLGPWPSFQLWSVSGIKIGIYKTLSASKAKAVTVAKEWSKWGWDI